MFSFQQPGCREWWVTANQLKVIELECVMLIKMIHMTGVLHWSDHDQPVKRPTRDQFDMWQVWHTVIETAHSPVNHNLSVSLPVTRLVPHPPGSSPSLEGDRWMEIFMKSYWLDLEAFVGWTTSLSSDTNITLLFQLDDTARYAGLLLAPAEGFSLRPRLFLPFGQKKSLLCCFGTFLAFFGVQ